MRAESRTPTAKTGSSPVPKMETFEVAKVGTTCPRCGGPCTGPYRKRVGKGDHHGFYYKHAVTEKGARRTIWHYFRRREDSAQRREKLVRLVKQQGWRGMRHFAGVLGVSEHTIRRDLDLLRKEGRIIHQPYGGYIADPSGTLLKEKPWIAWS